MSLDTDENETLGLDNLNEKYKFMRYALSLAKTANDLGEVPVGAIIVRKNKIISTGFNKRERTPSPLGHAEIEAIESASRYLNSWRLIDCDLYTTLEPCIMCAGAILQARLKTVVFGAKDPKGGAFGSIYDIHEDTRLNHKVKVHSQIEADTCSNLLRNFFRQKRASAK